jgi:hypothetical protein
MVFSEKFRNFILMSTVLLHGINGLQSERPKQNQLFLPNAALSLYPESIYTGVFS